MDGALLKIYHPEIPDFLRQAARAPALRRLQYVGMNCGCEYTSFPRFAALAPYARFEHSLGAGLITWHFTGEVRPALAALLHDIATPCFAHVIDFLNGDYLAQESTETGTAERIEGSPEIQAVLRAHGLTTADVSDYHAYPIADNASPRLSADRLEYTLGNAVNFGFARIDAVCAVYDDLTVGVGEDGAPELMFRREEAAHAFCDWSLRCSEIYVSDADRCAMQALAELLDAAILAGVIAREDLWRTEPEVIARLEADDVLREGWMRFCALNATERNPRALPGAAGWRVIPAKRRWIDPLVDGVRASARFPEYAARARAFLARSQEEPVRAFVQTV